MGDGYYTGAVCYQDGWHYTVVPTKGGGEEPGERLVLEDTADGSASRYRLATDADTRSWHDRKHRQFVLLTPEGGAQGVSVTAGEMAEIRKLLDERRGG